MWYNLILYGTEDLSVLNAYKIACEIFYLFDINPIFVSHYQKNEKNNDFKSVQSKLINVKSDLEKKLYKDFYLSDYKNKLDVDSMIFEYNEEYGGFHGVKLFTRHNKDLLLNLRTIISKICSGSNIEYGIFYNCHDSFDAISYSMGFNYLNIYPFENSNLFYKSMDILNGDEIPICYKNKLRMVYTYNILNINHMSIQINNQNLKWFILNNPDNGIIEQLNDYQFIWKVEDENIDRLNKNLGEAGVLISYEAPNPSPLKRPRLP